MNTHLIGIGLLCTFVGAIFIYSSQYYNFFFNQFVNFILFFGGVGLTVTGFVKD